jgi:hypothetical protein
MSNQNELEEILLLKREIAFQKVEIETLTSELILFKTEHIFQNNEKQKRADELFIANRELVFQNIEKQKRADELIIANEELIFQNKEKQKRADELFIANRELDFQNEEKQKRADELIIANKHLDLQYRDKKELSAKLIIAYDELKKTEEYLRSYIKGLEEMVFITSHKVRQPVAHILGIANLMNASTNYSFGELKKIIGYVKQSALSLDLFTKELTAFMNDMQKEAEQSGQSNGTDKI